MSQVSVVPVQPGPSRVPSRPFGAPERLRVLLVEDDDADAFLVRELLDEAGVDVELTVASTLSQARDGIAEADCVLLDLGLPDAQGLDGLRRVLALAQRAAVCVLTGLGDDHLGAAAVAEGAQDYLIKGQVDGTLLGRALRYAVERKRADENARRLHDVEILQQESRRLQRGLLPQPLLQTDAIVVHPFYLPGRHSALLGGDFYDVVQCAPDRVALMVGDVCGHGVDEAALGVELRVAWRALVLAGVPDGEVISAIEHVLTSERRSAEIFATLAMVTVDLTRAQVTVRLAGHPPPLLLGPDGVRVVPASHGPLLGVFPDAQRTATTVPLDSARWSLLLYTDGLIEGRTGGQDRRLEVGGLCALLGSAEGRRVPRAELPAWLVGRAEQANGGPLADDVAMLMVGPGGGT
jgi:serine phosphatase RsbU (regulator of sigma subunit)